MRSPPPYYTFCTECVISPSEPGDVAPYTEDYTNPSVANRDYVEIGCYRVNVMEVEGSELVRVRFSDDYNLQFIFFYAFVLAEHLSTQDNNV